MTSTGASLSPLPPSMPDESALDTLLKRDRLFMIIGVGILTSLAWGYMFYDAHRMAQGRSCCSALAKASLHHWPVSDLLLMFVMWTVMMIAMMVPSAAPMVLMFSALSRKRRAEARPYVPAGLFLLGYLLIWTGFSAVVTIAQWCLHATALLSPKMVSTSSYFAGALLIAAGVFQFTPVKRACLKHCCSPMQFLMTRWREGSFGVAYRYSSSTKPPADPNKATGTSTSERARHNLLNQDQ